MRRVRLLSGFYFEMMPLKNVEAYSLKNFFVLPFEFFLQSMGLKMPLKIVSLLGLLLCLSVSVVRAYEEPPAVSPQEALAKLVEGNKRFVEGQPQRPDAEKERLAETAKNGQHPFATVLACSDSRVPVEIVFDQGVGDIFVIRVAGNTSGGDEMGSIEYCVDHLGAPLLVVLGHTKCGAVTAAATEAETSGHLTALIDRIKPAVDRARTVSPDKKGEELVPQAIEENVWHGIEVLLTRSEDVRKRIGEGQLQVIGAVYDIEHGDVRWLGEHPKQENLLKRPIRAEIRRAPSRPLVPKKLLGGGKI